MNLLARFFTALASYFETRASAKTLVTRMAKLEEEHEQWRVIMASLRVDIAKCKLMVGLNQITEVGVGDE